MSARRYNRFFMRGLKCLALVYALICIFMWGDQRHLLYAPDVSINSPETYGLHDFTQVQLETKDAVHLKAWQHVAREGYPTIIYFHGKSGNLSSRAYYFNLLANEGFGILALDYRGYGASEGTPSEQGFYNDARAAMNYARDVLTLKNERIIIYGESIGTGVAVQMATEFASGGLVLQSPYTSISDIARLRYWWLPTQLLLRDKFDSLGKIANIHTPLLLFHGESDVVIPIKLAKELFDKAPEPKESVYMANRGHSNLDLKLLAELVLGFSEKHDLISGN